MKFATKFGRQYHLTLGMLLHYLGEKIKFSANVEVNAQTDCIFNPL